MDLLKPFQKEALQSLRTLPHTLLIAPTGSGKTLVFQRYIQEKRPRAVLISPLNALARQHELGFRRLGIPVSQGVGAGGQGPPDGPGVWILNPEKIARKFSTRLREWRPELLIVDEAHCVFEWGERFRPDFARVPGWVGEFAIPKSFWCTATLPEAALASLRGHFAGQLRVSGSFALPESLTLVRERVAPYERMDRLRALLREDPHRSGMIFVNTRHSSERVRAWLCAWGFDSVFYHAGMGLEERLGLEAALRARESAGRSIWVVATSAFGMGMDYPFLSRCILFEPSFSLLSLAQALGRVGRAGASAEAVVLWHEDDFQRHAWLADDSERARRALGEVRQWCQSHSCPRLTLEKYFQPSSLS